MATSREEVLANFQACTNIDDVAVCIMHLDECNWDLTQALNRVLSQDNEPFVIDQGTDPVPTLPDPMEENIQNAASCDSKSPVNPPFEHSVISYGSTAKTLPIDEDVIPLPVPSEVSDLYSAGPSRPRTRLLNFSIEYENKTVPLVIPDTSTPGAMKKLLFNELGIRPCKQELKGWKNHRRPSDHMKLSTMNLPKDNNLFLTTSDDSENPVVLNGDDDSDVEDTLNVNFKLNIKDKTNHEDYQLNFPGYKTLLEVKRDVFSLTDIPVRHQMWEGWPPGINDKSNLSAAGLDTPSHDLVLKRSPDSKKHSRKKFIRLPSSESSAEEFEDANESFTIEDDIFSNEMPKKSIPLIPNDVQDDYIAANSFREEFRNRYGESHPMFYPGSLEDALKEACFKPARERKQLLVYLHHDASVLTNVFCTQLLCSETIVSYIASNFIIWGWDLTFESNKERLLSMVMQHFGSVASSSIRNLSLEQLPLLLIINRCRSTNEVFSFIHGNLSLDELMTSLIHAVDVFSSQIAIETKEEDEREARESVKREQDYAYQASLLADQAKEQARKAEEEEKSRLQQEEHQRQQQIEEANKHEKALKEAIRQSLEQQLPPEPNENYVEQISRIRFRVPTGEFISRRFLVSDKLQVLLDFIASKGYPNDEFKVLSSWPRRDLTTLNGLETLYNLKLFPQETLILELR